MLQLSCARGELQKKTQKKTFARAELLAEADAAMPLGLAHQDPSEWPRIVQANILFRRPQNEVPRREVAKERRTYVRARLGPSNFHLWSEGRRGSKKLEGTQLLRPSQMMREERHERPRGHQRDPPLPALENSASPGKCAIKTIQVDLRPLLEKVVEPSGSWQGDMSEGVPRGDGWPSSSHKRSRGQDPRGGRVRDVLGGRRGHVGGGREDQVDGKYGGPVNGDGHVDRKRGGIKDGEVHSDGKDGDLRDGEDLTHGRTIPSKAEGLLRDKSSETLGLDTENSMASKGIRPQLPRNSWLAVTMLQPRVSSPISLPSILPKRGSPTEAESSTRWPAPASPDFQIPTRLLLRWLQETTTSQNHRLIAEVLSTLREELSVDGPKAGNPGEKRNPFLDLPQIRPRISGTLDAGQRGPGATYGDRKKKPNTFPWKVC